MASRRLAHEPGAKIKPREEDPKKWIFWGWLKKPMKMTPQLGSDKMNNPIKYRKFTIFCTKLSTLPL